MRSHGCLAWMVAATSRGRHESRNRPDPAGYPSATTTRMVAASAGLVDARARDCTLLLFCIVQIAQKTKIQTRQESGADGTGPLHRRRARRSGRPGRGAVTVPAAHGAA